MMIAEEFSESKSMTANFKSEAISSTTEGESQVSDFPHDDLLESQKKNVFKVPEESLVSKTF